MIEANVSHRGKPACSTPSALVLIAAAGAALIVVGCGGKPSGGIASKPNGGAAEIKGIDPKTIPLPKEATGVVQIITVEPGFAVFVDGEPARGENDDLLVTPCEVTVPRGRRLIVLAKRGFQEIHRELAVDDSEQLAIRVVSPLEAAEEESPLDAPLLSLAVGQMQPLESLNSHGAERDPFLSADGKSIWFVSERPGGKGIYTATRRSPYHEFDPPTLLAMTRSPDPLASPSVTSDGLLLAYLSPEKARVMGLVRPSIDSDFGNPDALQFAASDAYWPSAQVTGDGRQLFWTQSAGEGKPLTTMRATRKAADQPFSGTAAARLPGGHPCLSADGLRQYVFDGKSLRRARRSATEQPFSDLEVIATLELANYVPSTRGRQFHVSDDEQWLFYSDDPDTAGDLHLVRLRIGRGWGVAPRGTSAPGLPSLAKTDEKPEEPDASASKPAGPESDPREAPLPYATFRETFLELMADRKYDDAERAVGEARSDAKLANDVVPLNWDQQDIVRVKKFWENVAAAVKKLKAGDSFRIGSSKVEFVRFEQGVLHAKARTKEVDKKLDDMAPGDLAALVEDAFGKTDVESQRTIGTFLLYDKSGNERSAEVHLRRADSSGEELERGPARAVHVAEQELRRDKAGAALPLVEQVISRHGDSQAAKRARALSNEIYASVKWTPIGGRTWDGENGEYVAAPGKMTGAALQSAREYDNFELRTEWKVTGATGQGGVWFRWNGRRGLDTTSAFKIHLANDRDMPVDKIATGSLFKVDAPSANASLPEGKWNTLVLRVVGESVVVTINGKKVLETTASSKRIPMRGSVCLDGEVGGIAYRRTLLIDVPGPKPKNEPAPSDDD